MKDLKFKDSTIELLSKNSINRLILLNKSMDGWNFGDGKELQSLSFDTMQEFLPEIYNNVIAFAGQPSIFLNNYGLLEFSWQEDNDDDNYDYHIDIIFENKKLQYYIKGRHGEIDMDSNNSLENLIKDFNCIILDK